MSSLNKPEYRLLLVELVRARKEAQMTQEQLAASLNKPQSFIAKYERAERRLDILEFIEITKILGADYKELIDRATRAI